jgi:DNA-binding transcriptional MerR regulator
MRIRKIQARDVDMAKAAEAFRTISEVASDLDVPKHVLRFWEAKFPQIRPMKRGGGRRYYRPEDMELLKGIRRLLHAEGYTIKGVQKILREQGVDQVKAFAHLAASEKTKGRAKGKADGAVAAADAKLAVAAPQAKGADGRASRGVVAPASLDALVRSAIVELDACRRLLLGEAEAVAVPAKAVRVGRG